MSDGEKSFDATPARRARARREGNVPRANEFGANVAFAAAALATPFIIPMFQSVARQAVAHAAAGNSSEPFVLMLVCAGVVPLTAAAIAGIAAGIAQTGGLVVVAPSLKFERLSPVEGVKRMLSRETAMHAVRATIAFAVGSAAISFAVRDVIGAAIGASPLQTASAAFGASERVIACVAGLGIVLALFEWSAARRSWLKKLKMSFHELKRELREHDGDPQTRGRRRSLHRSLARGSLTKVKDAAFVVVNPTHVAIALAYAPPAIPVPVVLVRAADEMALRVRALAAEASIPTIEDVALARALFRDAHVGAAIPREHYIAVAEIVAALARAT